MYLEISNPMDYHVALYIRLSKEDENEGPSESVTNQKSLLNEFVQQHRLSVYDTYIDDGWSGTNFDRPDFQRMIGDIEAKKVNMVITKDLSRLGRDYIMTGHYMERYFPEKRVRYISLLDGIDTGVESTANLVALPRRHTELLAQAPRFGTMAKTSGDSVIARGKDTAILHDDRPYRTAQARSACCYLFSELHEVLIPGRTRVNERTWCLLWV